MKKKPETTAPLAYPVNDFAKVMGVSRATIYKMMKAEELRTFTIRGRRLVPATEAERLMQEAQ